MYTEEEIYQIPQDLVERLETFFGKSNSVEAVRLIKTSQVSLSFKKGVPDQFFIVSGIVRDNKTFETRITHKTTSENPDLKSICNCKQWNEQTHCPHAASLFLKFHLQYAYQQKVQLTGSHLESYIGDIGVVPEQYGTIIPTATKLKGASPNSTYTSIQYLLKSRKVVNFSIPKNFHGKLIINFLPKIEIPNILEDDFEYLKPTNHLPFTFKWMPEGSTQASDFISIFESIYLFNWETGEVFNLPKKIQDFISSVRIRSTVYEMNDLIRMSAEMRKDNVCEIQFNQKNIFDYPSVDVKTSVSIEPGDRKAQLLMYLRFTGLNDLVVEPPSFLRCFTFEDGLLDSFKRKTDALDFIHNIFDTLQNKNEDYLKTIRFARSRIILEDIIKNFKANTDLFTFDQENQTIIRFDQPLIALLLNKFNQYFTETIFRSAVYKRKQKEIIFETSSTQLFQGISSFYQDLKDFGVSIFFKKQKIKNWSTNLFVKRKNEGLNWFNIEIDLDRDTYNLIKKTDLENGIVFSDDGLVLLNEEQKSLVKFLKKYINYEGSDKDLAANSEERKKVIIPFARSRIFELFELKKLGIDNLLTKEEEDICSRLLNLKELPTYPIAENLEKVLWPYQKEGYNWLRFLFENKLGACLADDMGLGKTLQTIVFLQSIIDRVEKVLIVCPVSILMNWKSEIEKFSSLKCSIFYGGERTFPEDEKIVITSYGLMKKEVEGQLLNRHFDILILDEVQHLKNSGSLGAISARKIQSQFRLCLTGTPVENDIGEFYNILDLSLPGIWGDIGFFRNSNSQKSKLLAKKIAKPFILRRTKTQVLHDLPEKVENRVVLTFLDTERENYNKAIAKIRDNLNNKTQKHKYGEILKGILELRQLCLWQKDPINFQSTKINFLLETLEQIINEGHQAIVFSQFTTYLDFIQGYISKRNWSYSRIDGSQVIKKRISEIEKFQGGNSKVFLISLKAGGVGLNLTAASYVFIMDPWWNPAVENQAIDRAHRIGQTNKLTVYKPVIKDSIEEKVLLLQENKKELFKDLMSEDDLSYYSGKLTLQDFTELLS